MTTRFPSGLSSRGVPVFGGILTTGAVRFVQSTHALAADDPSHGSQARPYATIDYAIGQSTANNDDHIIVMPGHVDTLATSAGIALDVAGVNIIGIGRGSLRPKVVLDLTQASINVSAANCSIKNIVCEASFADVDSAIDVTAANCSLEEIHFQEAGADLNFKDYILASSTTDNAVDGLSIVGCTGYGIDGAINSALLISADLAGLVFAYNRFNTDHANALAMIQVATGKDLNNCWVVHNYYASLKVAGDIFIDNDTAANDGWVAHNRAQHLDTTSEILVDCDGVGQFDNLGTGVVTASGYLLPAVDS